MSYEVWHDVTKIAEPVTLSEAGRTMAEYAMAHPLLVDADPEFALTEFEVVRITRERVDGRDREAVWKAFRETL